LLGFVKKTDIPMGEFRWLTVVSPDDPEGVELLWSRINTPPLDRSSEPWWGTDSFTSFGVADVQAEYDRLRSAGVHFTQPPVAMGPVTTAVLDDTCGNLIQIAQKH
jgi:hypothetical protein